MLQGILDVHAHAFPDKIYIKAVQQLETYYGINITNQGNLKGLQLSAKEAGVTHLAVNTVATSASYVGPANDWIINLIKQDIIGLGTMHPDYLEPVKKLERLAQFGVKGIKFHAEFQNFLLDDPKMWPIYEAIADRFVVMFHMGDKSSTNSEPRRLANVLDAFPKMKVIAAHLGGWSMWDAAEKYLLQRDIYLDTSSTQWCLEPDRIYQIIKKHGIDRVLFGTDYPIRNHREELEAFETLPFSQKERDKILWHNGCKLFNLSYL